MASGTEDSGIAWLTPLFADEGVLREAFAQRLDLMKEVLRNKGFLDTLFDAKSGAFAKLLATPAEGTADVDALIGLVGGDGGSATPRQMTVAGRLEAWLADGDKAEQAFRAHPELTQALVDNPAFVERIKVLKPQFFRELLAKGKKRFRGDAGMLAAIERSERGLSTFTAEGGLQNEQAEAAWKQGERLVKAVREGNEKAIKSLLSRKDVKEFIDHQDGDGSTALLEAAYKGHTETVKVLLDKGADANLQDKGGSTALMWAAGVGDTETVKLLLDKGADANLQAGDGWTALMSAARWGHPEIVKLLLDKGAAANLQDKRGSTALMWAAGAGDTETVKLLLDKGADANLQAVDGSTALMLAVYLGRAEIADLLRSAMEQKDKPPWTGRENDRRRERDDRERGPGREG